MSKSPARITPIVAAKKRPTTQPFTKVNPHLGPGLHAARVEKAVASDWEVYLLDGRKMLAGLGPSVVPALLEQCVRDGRLVILADCGQGPVVLGALQTAPVFSPDARGTLDLEVERVNIVAKKEMILRSGESCVELQPNGKAKLRGRQLVINASDNVKVRSALVELP